MKILITLTCCIFLLVNLNFAYAAAFDWVLVGNPENPPNRQGYGQVGYLFEISTTEVTNAQYAEFLNACARYDDPYRLFNQNQEDGLFGGIGRKKLQGEYYYIPKPGWEKRPVVYVSWRSAARFANWLHYAQPNTGRAEMGTTEGDINFGAYNTQSFGGSC